MKTIYLKFIIIIAAVFLVSCENDDDSLTNTDVSAVEALYAPQDNTFFNLGAQSSALFEWQAAKAADNGVVLYDVAFDTEAGDFSNPVYVIPSDGKGLQRTLNLSFTDLNKIAELAGIPTKSTGKLKWTVLSSKGLNKQSAETSGLIEVERPGGFPTPDELFLTGTATEGGDNIADAVAFKKTGATTYEGYTSLTMGEYYFINRKSDTSDKFSINGTDLVADGTTNYEGDDSVFRIRLDFSDGSVNMVKVNKVELWFPPLGEYLFDFNYVGNGTWSAQNEYMEFKQESWGRDERYKFKFTLGEEGSEYEEWYGSTNGDNQRPNENTDASYWYMVPVTDDYWSNSFKFDGSADEANITIEVIFNGSTPSYTHTVTVL